MFEKVSKLIAAQVFEPTRLHKKIYWRYVMKSIKVFVYIFVIAAFLAVGGIGFHTAHSATVTTEKASSPASSLNKLENHFQKAKEYIEKQVYGKAASEVRSGAAILKNETGQVTGEARKSLLKAEKELDGLVSDLEKGTIKSTDNVNVAFSKAHNAMAEYYNAEASESWSKKAISQAGEYLKGAANALEKAWTWSGRRIESGTGAAIGYAREVADKIEKGMKWGSAEVSKAVDDLRTEIGKFRQEKQETTEKPLKVMPIETAEGAIPHVGLSTAISRVAEDIIPAVVQIQVTQRREVPNPYLPFEKSPFFRHYFGLPKQMPKKFKEELKGLGTGMIVDSEGHILTNNHVVGGATEIKVLLSNGDEYPAKLVGTDPKTDLGVIKISAEKPLPHVSFGNSDQVVVGQWVVAIGHPRGLDQTVTQGIISAKHRAGITDPSSYQDFLQTDAAINPGNSGGPLLTLRGLVIGVNSAIATQSGGFEGIGFAIPSKMAVHIASALIVHGKVERGWLGISIQEVTPDLAKSFGLAEPKGALIADVMKGGPGEEAGLKRGDVFLEYRGKEIDNAAELRNNVADTPVGKEVKVVVWREKKKVELTVKIGNLEELREKLAAVVKKRLGVAVGPVTPEEAANYGLPAPEGVSVQWVDPKGPLGKVGFEKGDLILAIQKQPVSGVDSFVSMVNSLPHHQKVVLLALDHRRGNTSYVQVEVN
jgi:serine protease Do